ncbi:5-carboxymethyl-2-hydroxymuconate Delta-isomerase [Simplicispira hankyongi]|uniref:5-carboxymethyl-2-hydroxymuconate Delta-isomerase n=1 Tax=Simplicispira hankyongi TaxID=2315688 RepID=A0A398CDE5_9BURK|nr:5-carboxymethyl-2-hydroxymuconate Delta-isomerase [Simplicispira hankyongi]RID98240.1 5-carboxymethyl-2-hydroxymuconate Delta-isomerase [Simplicispira hankyongi]
MPHLTVEYSANLAPFPERKALGELNEALCASPEVQTEADLKTRFVCQSSFAVGTESGPRGFVHAQLRLLAGRTPEAKQDLAERVATVLRRRTPKPEGMLVQLSVEIVDMDRPSYIKERL